MGSKISKQKQMFSMLNHKFSGLWDENIIKESKPIENQDENFTTNYSSHLLNKVYNFYKSLIQNLNSGLITSDLGGEITFVNTTAATMLNYEREELLGKNLREIFAQDQ